METGIIIASISAAAASGGLIFTAYERHKETQIATGTFWLELEKMFQRYDPLYSHLRFQCGDWVCKDNVGPTSKEELEQLCDYLGLFEHCYFLLKKGSIDLNTFESIYKTRVMGLLSNQLIQNELSNEKWGTFRDLLYELKLMKNRKIIPITEVRKYIKNRKENTFDLKY